MRIVPVAGRQVREERRAERDLLDLRRAGRARPASPTCTIDYSFHQKQAEGEKVLQQDGAAAVERADAAAGFNVAAGHQLPGSLVVPLTSFPAGDYRLEIKVTDKASGKSVTQNVNFHGSAGVGTRRAQRRRAREQKRARR